MMDPKPISVQLYSLRNESKVDFPGVLKRVSDIGYTGVEPAGFYGVPPKEFRTMVEDLGMVVSSSHGPWCSPDNIPEVIEVAGQLGTSYIACGFGSDQFKSLDVIKETADKVNSMIDKLEGSGLTLIQHNHAWEFDMLDGRLKYDIYAELCPRVQFEIDVYWAANYGSVNAVEQVSKFAHRIPLLHIKDGPLERDKAMLAVGHGKMDIPACVNAADPDVLKWLVVELDLFDGDMFSAVEDSYRYLVSNGLASGRK